jgi:RNA polymerase sigma-70 factor (ECF subfamily)
MSNPAHPIRPELEQSSPDDRPSDDLLGDLLARSARGDEVAFVAFYDATARRTFGLVLRLVRNHSIAEEVTQEAFVQVWRNAGRFDSSKGVAISWLMTMAHRRAVDRIRTTERGSRQDTAYHQRSSTIDWDSTADAVEASWEAARVRAALKSLSAAQREVLELAYFGGFTHTEIAQMTGIPLGTAKTRIRDGLIRLRGLIDDAA